MEKCRFYNWFTEGFDTPTSSTPRPCSTNSAHTPFGLPTINLFGPGRGSRFGLTERSLFLHLPDHMTRGKAPPFALNGSVRRFNLESRVWIAGIWVRGLYAAFVVADRDEALVGASALRGYRYSSPCVRKDLDSELND
jgi:hypothetical protein